MPYNKDRLPSTPKLRATRWERHQVARWNFSPFARALSSSTVSLMAKPSSTCLPGSHRGLPACDSLSSPMLVSTNTSMSVSALASSFFASE